MFDGWLGIVAVVLFCVLVNLPFGWWRSGLRKFSARWILAVHAPVPLAIAARLLLGVPAGYIPLFVVASIGGQYLGGKLRRGKPMAD